MTSLFGENAYLNGEKSRPVLGCIFRPIGLDLEAVQECLTVTLQAPGDPMLGEIAGFLLASPGKRIRPALALLSAGAAHEMGDGSRGLSEAPVRVAAAVELIHMASLVHDDLIDAAPVRHHRASVPAKWGRKVAVSVGDHLCAQAFQLVAQCADPRLFAILGSQLVVMCEGELQQVAGRGDFDLGERRCLAMIEKKTASLFGACCGMGAVAAGGEPKVCEALQEFGFHVGIAFQILDDCKDLLSDRDGLGKSPGQDLRAGDVTLPLLYAIRQDGGLGSRPSGHGSQRMRRRELMRLAQAFRSSRAPAKIVEWVGSHVGRARRELESIANSGFRASLHLFADYLEASVSGILTR